MLVVIIRKPENDARVEHHQKSSVFVCVSSLLLALRKPTYNDSKYLEGNEKRGK